MGFLGAGWIGRDRMAAMIASETIEPVAIADPSPEMLEAALKLAPRAVASDDLDELLTHNLDGLVIATPSALHATQSIIALERGVAVFCQKPLGRHAGEARKVVETARRANRLLGVDFSYRHVWAFAAVRDLVQSGDLGPIRAMDVTFHNAYGPDKPWFYDRAQSGGGCVMDLGVHLIDLTLWMLNFPELMFVSSRLLGDGTPIIAMTNAVEDYAAALLQFKGGTVVRFACSWRLQAGCEAAISAEVYGARGGAAAKNVGGSFYSFTAERFLGTRTETLPAPPDPWSGRAAVAWARRLAESPHFDDGADDLIKVSEVMDRIYLGS